MFQIYNRLSRKTLTLWAKAFCVVILTYIFSLGLILINMSMYRYMTNKVPILLDWDRYLIIAFTNFFIILVLSILYFLINHWQELQLQKEKTLTANAIANEAQLQMLRYQLNPHFLFNALNSIRTLIYHDRNKADRMITDLSDILRYSLAKNDDHEVELKDEIDIIKNYLEIQGIRFEEKLKVELDIRENTLDIKIPCFLIHPLVENAVKFGIETSAPPLEIRVSARAKNNTLRVEVSNTGRYDENAGSKSNGTGINNVQMRLNHFFPGRNRFEIRGRSGWVHAIIEVELEADK